MGKHLDRAFHRTRRVGKAWRAVGAMLDLTERLRAEHELFELNQRLQALMQAVPVGISFSDDPPAGALRQSCRAGPIRDILRDNLSASARMARRLAA